MIDWIRIFAWLPICVSVVTADIRVAFAGCDGSGDQIETNNCAYNRFNIADKKLNNKYNEIESCFKYDSKTKAAFLSAQRQWIKFRDAECRFEVSDNSGTMTELLKAECAIAITNKRIKDFDELIDCAGGETGGVCPTIDCEFKKTVPKNANAHKGRSISTIYGTWVIKSVHVDVGSDNTHAIAAYGDNDKRVLGRKLMISDDRIYWNKPDDFLNDDCQNPRMGKDYANGGFGIDCSQNKSWGPHEVVAKLLADEMTLNWFDGLILVLNHE